MGKLVFKSCPVCGKDPVILKDSAGGGDEAFFIARCPDVTCILYNEETFDSLDACCSYWNGLVAAHTTTTETEENDDDGKVSQLSFKP